MHIRPYLTFAGECEQAIALYKKAFQTHALQLTRFSDLPPSAPLDIPDTYKHKILQCTLKIGDDYSCLENIATLTQCGAYLGALSLTADMPEGKAYIELTEYLNQKMPQKPSIVINAVASAMKGHYGNHHPTHRTKDTLQYINPFMPLQWCFRLEDIASRIGFADRVQDSQDIYDVVKAYRIYRAIIIRRVDRAIPLL